MFDLLKMNRINKITANHSEKVSDNMILMNIVNSMDAKKNLDKDQFKTFCEVFDRLKKKTVELSLNSLQYEHRAFAIAYEFEMSGIPYEKICGDSTDNLYMYSNMKPRYDELINGLISEYTTIVEDIIKESTEIDLLTIWAYSLEFYDSVTTRVISCYSTLMGDYFTQFVYNTAYRKMSLFVHDKFVGGNNNSFHRVQSDMNTVNKLSDSVFENSNDLIKYVDGFINSFLYLVKIHQDSPIKNRLVDVVCDLADIGTGKNTKPTQTNVESISCNMDDDEIQDFVNRICEKSKKENFELSREDAMQFVTKVLNVDYKADAVRNFQAIVDLLKKKTRYQWYVQASLFLRIMADNDIISEEEVQEYSSSLQGDLYS